MTPLRLALLATATAATLVVGLPAVADAPPPTARSLGELRLGERRVHRLLSVHALHVAEDAPRVLDLRVTAEPRDVRVDAAGDDLAVRLAEKGLPRLLVPGRLVKGPEEDYAVASYRLARHDDAARLDPTRASDDAERREPALTGAILAPALRWNVIEEPRDTEVKERAQTWARKVGLDTERDSPLELASAPRIAATVRAYREALATLPAAPTGRRAAGYAVFVDGRLGLIEWTASSADVPGLWTAALRGLAVEAAYLESEAGVLDVASLDSRSAARVERGWVRRALERLRKGDFDTERAASVSREHGVRVDQSTLYGHLRALEWKGHTVHGLFLRDPASRSVPGTDDVEPGVIERQGATTIEEARVEERRD